MGKWDLTFDSRRPERPAFDVRYRSPLHPPAMPPADFTFILPLVYVSMFSYPPISLYDMGGALGPIILFRIMHDT